MMTPRDDGFRMPPEWGPHQAALMAWPTKTREAFWARCSSGPRRTMQVPAGTYVR